MCGQGRFCQPGSDKGMRGTAGSNNQAVHTSPAVIRARCPCREKENLPGQCRKSCFPFDLSLFMPPCAARVGAWLCLKWLSLAQCPSVCISHFPVWPEGPQGMLLRSQVLQQHVWCSVPSAEASSTPPCFPSRRCSSPSVCRRGWPRLWHPAVGCAALPSEPQL